MGNQGVYQVYCHLRLDTQYLVLWHADISLCHDWRYHLDVSIFCCIVCIVALTHYRRLTRIAGCVPLEISFLVAFSQLVPAHTVALFKGVISMRVPRFPGLYVLTVIVLAITPVLTSAAVFLALYGFMVSWAYLRFYKTAFPDLDTSQSTLRGDASESFALAEFFPEPLRPAVSHISESVFALLVSMRLCSPFSAADSVAHRNRGDFSSSRSTPGSSRAETERRRALALKALDQRLNASMTSKVSQPTNTLGGDVVQQPGSVVQAPMIDSKNNGILGETSYSPEGEDSNH